MNKFPPINESELYLLAGALSFQGSATCESFPQWVMPKKPQKSTQKSVGKPVKKPDDAKTGYVSNIDTDAVFYVAALFPKGSSEVCALVEICAIGEKPIRSVVFQTDGDVETLFSSAQGRLFAKTPGGCAATLVAEAIERAGKYKQPLTDYQSTLQYFWRNSREEVPSIAELLNSGGADQGVSGDDGGAEATSQLFDTGPEYNVLTLNRVLDEAHLARPSVITERASWLSKERDLWISLAAAKIESDSLKELINILATHMV